MSKYVSKLEEKLYYYYYFFFRTHFKNKEKNDDDKFINLILIIRIFIKQITKKIKTNKHKDEYFLK